MDSGGARREGAAAPLQPVWHAHASGAADQSRADVRVQTEHSDMVTEEGRRDRDLMRGDVFQPHGRRRGGVYRGGGDFQIPGIDIGLVR